MRLPVPALAITCVASQGCFLNVALPVAGAAQPRVSPEGPWQGSLGCNRTLSQGCAGPHGFGNTGLCVTLDSDSGLSGRVPSAVWCQAEALARNLRV